MKAIEAYAKAEQSKLDRTLKFYGKEVYHEILSATLLGHFLCVVKIPSYVDLDALLNIAAKDGYAARISEDRGMFTLHLDWTNAKPVT